MAPATEAALIRARRERPDLVGPESPPGLRVWELAAVPGMWTTHVYMESQVFTPDSRRFVFARFRNPGQGDERRLRRDYLLCDLEDRGSLRQLTDHPGATAPAVSPDGRWLYHVIDEAVPGRGRIILMRVSLENFAGEAVAVVDRPPHGCDVVPSRINNLGSISSDGRRYCTFGFLGDGRRRDAHWGLLAFDVEKRTCEVVWTDAEACNMHPQYCRARSGPAAHDILIQHNHGSLTAPDGSVERWGAPLDAAIRVTGEDDAARRQRCHADIHVIRDDGSERRDLPWGRDGRERCQGHQAWRGGRASAITSTRRELADGTTVSELIEGWPVPVAADAPHLGAATGGGRRTDLTAGVERPDFCHFALDEGGVRMVVDSDGRADRAAAGKIWLAALPDDGAPALFRFLLHSRASNGEAQHTHAHPFLSPDCNRAFFNSDESGEPHIYMADGFAWPPQERVMGKQA